MKRIVLEADGRQAAARRRCPPEAVPRRGALVRIRHDAASYDPAMPDAGTATAIDPLAAFRLDGRTAIVTGASSGLGARFARVLHGAGATVVLAARRADRIEALAAELGERVHTVATDVTDDAQCAALVAAAVERTGRLDVLVNNAGISGDHINAERESLEQFRHVVDVDLTSLFVLSQAAFPALAASGNGAIVNIASVLGLVASTPLKQASYCAAKGAVVNLTRELGCQWARKNVRVNGIAPGWFPSEMTTEMFENESSASFMNASTPAGRGGAEHELDGALLLLASDAGSFIVGQTLVVDGGWTAR